MAIQWQSPTHGPISFTKHAHASLWNEVAGIYMFCRLESQGTYTPLYIGQAGSLKQRIPQHEQWPRAVQQGASFVLAALVPIQIDRDNIERQLIQHFNPTLNTQHKNALAGLLYAG